MPKIIDYFKEGFIKHPDFKNFKSNFKWLESSEYENISQFYNHTADMCYKTSWIDINFKYLEQLTKENRIYLFRIHNKDFNPGSKGKKNINTLIFLELFKTTNNSKLKLLGNAEIFYRKESISSNIDPKRSKTFEIIKNKRYTKEKYFLHFPIEIKGRKLQGSFNKKINECIKNENVNILGIDKGEKHLIYYSLIDQNCKIIEQGSFNIINGKNYNSELTKKMK